MYVYAQGSGVGYLTSKAAKQEKPKLCFFIAPIGDEGDEIRRWSDEVLEVIVKPAASEFGYKVVRADIIKSAAKTITTQVIQHCINADLVVADLSGQNPNVFYELAIRHAVGKPVIQMIQQGENIPFDIKPVRTVTYDRGSPRRFLECCKELKEYIRDSEENPGPVENPITIAAGTQTLASSENPLEQIADEIVSGLGNINTQLEDLRVRFSRLVHYRTDPTAYLRDLGTPRLIGSKRVVLKALLDHPEISSAEGLKNATGLNSRVLSIAFRELQRYGLADMSSSGSIKLTDLGRTLGQAMSLFRDDLQESDKAP